MVTCLQSSPLWVFQVPDFCKLEVYNFVPNQPILAQKTKEGRPGHGSGGKQNSWDDDGVDLQADGTGPLLDQKFVPKSSINIGKILVDHFSEQTFRIKRVLT